MPWRTVQTETALVQRLCKRQETINPQNSTSSKHFWATNGRAKGEGRREGGGGHGGGGRGGGGTKPRSVFLKSATDKAKKVIGNQAQTP